MRHAVRNSIIVASAVIGFNGFAAIAARPAVGDPTVIDSPAMALAKSADREEVTTIEQRIKAMHATLLITPTQQSQWDGFAQMMRENAREMDQAFAQRTNTMSNMTAPENMQSYAQVTMSHAQNMQKLVSAFQALYDTMSDGQKKTADQIFRDDAHRGKPVRHG